MIRVPKNKIAVAPIQDPDTTASGRIIIPDVAKQREDQGIVKYVGEDVKEICIGDYVLFSGYTGTSVYIEDEGHLIIMPEDFVVCRIDPPDTEVRGMYFRGVNGDYFPATYEMTMELIAQAFKDSLFSDRFKIKDLYASRPSVKDYDKLRGG